MSFRAIHRRFIAAPFVVCVLLTLAACGGSSQSATATAVTSPSASVSASVSPTAGNAPQVATQAIATTAGPTTPPSTPTPLAPGLQTTIARTPDTPQTTQSAATTAPTARATTAVTTAATPTSSATVRTTTAAGSATSSTATGTRAAGSAAAVGTGTVEPTTTPVPVTSARGTAEQFLRAVTSKGEIAAFVSPSLNSQSGGDGYKLLGIQGTITEFTIDSEQLNSSGDTATVTATVTTSAGTTQKTLTCTKQGSGWVVTAVS